MSEFDAKRALREEIEGLAGVVKTIGVLAHRAEQDLGEAEAKHGALAKLDAFAKDELKRRRGILRALEEQEKVP